MSLAALHASGLALLRDFDWLHGSGCGKNAAIKD